MKLTQLELLTNSIYIQGLRDCYNIFRKVEKYIGFQTILIKAETES